MAHRILLRAAVIDAPADTHDRELEFWAGALRATAVRGSAHPEYHGLRGAAATLLVATQQVGAGTDARVHLDLETDDVTAEVGRLVRLGAVELSRTDDWVVLADPAGLPFCVVPPTSADFVARAVLVDEL